MKKEAIAEVINSANIQGVTFDLTVMKQDVLLFLEKSLQQELSKLDQLPDGIQLELLHFQDLEIQDQHIVAKAKIRVISDKILLPDQMDLDLHVDLPINVLNGYLHVNQPAIDVFTGAESWKQKMLAKILNKLVDWNAKKINSILDNKVNPSLQSPDLWSKILHEKIPLEIPLIPDYNMEALVLNSDDNFLQVQSTLDVSVNKALDKTITASTIELNLKSEKLFPLLMEKINQDIQEKIEQDVEIKSIQIVEKNTLSAEALVSMMNIRKSVSITAVFQFSKPTGRLRLLVENMEIDGGFLLQRGFSVVAPTVKKKIEEAVNLDLNTLIQKLEIPIPIPLTDREYMASFSQVLLTDLSIFPVENNVQVTTEFSECTLVCKPLINLV